jgi:SMC interacting uncharacterized protein involved in chromosome segregation
MTVKELTEKEVDKLIIETNNKIAKLEERIRLIELNLNTTKL